MDMMSSLCHSMLTGMFHFIPPYSCDMLTFLACNAHEYVSYPSSVGAQYVKCIHFLYEMHSGFLTVLASTLHKLIEYLL